MIGWPCLCLLLLEIYLGMYICGMCATGASGTNAVRHFRQFDGANDDSDQVWNDEGELHQPRGCARRWQGD